MKRTPREQEWNRMLKQEDRYIRSRADKKDTKLNQLLSEKVPEKLQDTLDAAFAKAFEAIFSKGTGIIEKTYKKDQLKLQHKVNSYAADLSENRKTLRRFGKDAAGRGNKNLLFSGLSGMGMGLVGVGLPDIPLFTATILKSLYEIALGYGYDYERPEERYFILKTIEGALSYGAQLSGCNDALNTLIEHPVLPPDFSEENQIKITAATMSKELLYLKFLQGIPVVGTVGGAYNTVYLQRIQKFAKMKYYRRFLHDRAEGNTSGKSEVSPPESSFKK